MQDGSCCGVYGKHTGSSEACAAKEECTACYAPHRFGTEGCAPRRLSLSLSLSLSRPLALPLSLTLAPTRARTLTPIPTPTPTLTRPAVLRCQGARLLRAGRPLLDELRLEPRPQRAPRPRPPHVPTILRTVAVALSTQLLTVYLSTMAGASRLRPPHRPPRRDDCRL